MSIMVVTWTQPAIRNRWSILLRLHSMSVPMLLLLVTPRKLVPPPSPRVASLIPDGLLTLTVNEVGSGPRLLSVSTAVLVPFDTPSAHLVSVLLPLPQAMDPMPPYAPSLVLKVRILVRLVLLSTNVPTIIRLLMALTMEPSTVEFTTNRLTTNSERKTATMVLSEAA